MYHSKWQKGDNEPPPIGLIGTYAENGDKPEFVRFVDDYEKDTFEAAKETFGVKAERKGLPLVLIPRALASLFQYYGAGSTTHKMTCQYEAIKSFASNLLGVTLDMDDADWFQRCPLVGENGVPMQHTLRVAQELLEPYHLRVCRVRLTPGLSVPGDLAQWQEVLGCNPLGLVDCETDNATFATQAGITLEEANGLFRFEFSPDPLRPGISCASGGVTADLTGASGATLLGHASYRSPRAKPFETPWLQFQVDREERVQWNRLPVFPVVEQEAKEEEDKGGQRISLWMSKAPDGRMLSDIARQGNKDWHTPYSHSAGYNGSREDYGSAEGQRVAVVKSMPRMREPRVGNSVQTFEYRNGGVVALNLQGSLGIGECFVCEKAGLAMSAPHCCDGCWTKLWEPFACKSQTGVGGCGAQFADQSPRFLSCVKDEVTGRWSFTVACEACGKIYRLPVESANPRSEIIKDVAFGQRPSQQDYEFLRLADNMN